MNQYLHLHYCTLALLAREVCYTTAGFTVNQYLQTISSFTFFSANPFLIAYGQSTLVGTDNLLQSSLVRNISENCTQSVCYTYQLLQHLLYCFTRHVALLTLLEMILQRLTFHHSAVGLGEGARQLQYCGQHDDLRHITSRQTYTVQTNPITLTLTHLHASTAMMQSQLTAWEVDIYSYIRSQHSLSVLWHKTTPIHCSDNLLDHIGSTS